MRAPVSIVIPTLNAARDLGPCLGALGKGLAAGLVRELVVSDGGSDDDTAEIAETVGAVWITGAAGRGGQLRRGAAAARGDWLLFVHADTFLAADWPQAVMAHIAAHPDRVGYFRLSFRDSSAGARAVAAWANLRSRLFGLPYGDQGLLVPRGLYDEVGGFAEMPLMEDVDLVRRLRGRLVPMNATAFTGAERFGPHGWLGQGARNLWRLARFLAGADPAKLAQGYGRGDQS